MFWNQIMKYEALILVYIPDRLNREKLVLRRRSVHATGWILSVTGQSIRNNCLPFLHPKWKSSTGLMAKRCLSHQGLVAQKLQFKVSLPSMVTAMETLILNGCSALLPWKLPLMAKLPSMVSFMQRDPGETVSSVGSSSGMGKCNTKKPNEDCRSYSACNKAGSKTVPVRRHLCCSRQRQSHKPFLCYIQMRVATRHHNFMAR